MYSKKKMCCHDLAKKIRVWIKQWAIPVFLVLRYINKGIPNDQKINFPQEIIDSFFLVTPGYFFHKESHAQKRTFSILEKNTCWNN